MEKPAATEWPIHDLIRRRWSPRAFAPRAVAADVLRTVLEAARWAASSFNEQPWYFIVATQDDPQEFQKMLACLMEKNQQWAKGAPVLMISVMKTAFTQNGKPNRVAMHDVGAASASLTLEALSHGVFVHQMAGIDADKIRETYHIPAGYKAVAGIALGYPGDLASLPEGFREAEKSPRTRKPLTQFVFSKAWDNPSELVQ
jgi:nitroreductase